MKKPTNLEATNKTSILNKKRGPVPIIGRKTTTIHLNEEVVKELKTYGYKLSPVTRMLLSKYLEMAKTGSCHFTIEINLPGDYLKEGN